MREVNECEACDGDGYVDIVDDWGGVIGPAPCPNCSDDDPLEAVDLALETHSRPSWEEEA